MKRIHTLYFLGFGDPISYHLSLSPFSFFTYPFPLPSLPSCLVDNIAKFVIIGKIVRVMRKLFTIFANISLSLLFSSLLFPHFSLLISLSFSVFLLISLSLSSFLTLPPLFFLFLTENARIEQLSRLERERKREREREREKER